MFSLKEKIPGAPGVLLNYVLISLSDVQTAEEREDGSSKLMKIKIFINNLHISLQPSGQDNSWTRQPPDKTTSGQDDPLNKTTCGQDNPWTIQSLDKIISEQDKL
jgi:hypothetical protein